MILREVNAQQKLFMLIIQNNAIALMNIINSNQDAHLVWSTALHVLILFPALKQSLIETFLVVKYIFLLIIMDVNGNSLMILM